MFFFFITLLFWPSISKAHIIENSVSIGAASNVIQNNTKNWKVFGSFAGSDQTPKGQVVKGTINSCTFVTNENSFTGCNTRRVLPTTELVISFSDNEEFQGRRGVIAYTATTTNSTPRRISLVNENELYSPDSTYEVRISWLTLCQLLGGIISENTQNDLDSSQACMDMDEDDRSSPLNGSKSIYVGLDDNAGSAVDPIKIDIVLATPLKYRYLYNPNIGSTEFTGSDGHRSISSCAGELLDFNCTDKGCRPTKYLDTGTTSSLEPAFCDYQITPGDEKIYIEDDESTVHSLRFNSIRGSYTQSSTTIRYLGFRLFISTKDFTYTFPGNTEFTRTNFLKNPGDLGGGFKRSSFSGGNITNGTPVFSRLAALDEANNVIELFSNDLLSTFCGALDSPPNPNDSSDSLNYYLGQDPSLSNLCPYATIPSLVTGILSRDLNCFVATALEGSPYKSQILALRQFRNQFLKPFSWGQKLIDFYSTYGPPAAQWLNKHPEYKGLFRVLLWPAYLIARLFNTWGGFWSLIFLLLAFIMSIMLIFRLPFRSKSSIL